MARSLGPSAEWLMNILCEPGHTGAAMAQSLSGQVEHGRFSSQGQVINAVRTQALPLKP